MNETEEKLTPEQGDSTSESETPEQQATEEQVVEDSNQELDGLKAQLAEADDKLRRAGEEVLRAHAEVENFRKRSAREIENARKFALERFMADLLEVNESLERGLEAADGEQVSAAQLKDGMELTLKMLNSVCAKHGLQQINPEGEKFNPEHHEALSMVPSDNAEPDTIINVVQKGFILNDRLLRPARVIVAKSID